MKKIAASLVLVVLTAVSAFAQTGPSVKQSGNVTPQHAACWTTNGVVQDCGTAAIPYLTSIGTWGSGPTNCAQSAQKPPYNQVCIGGTSTQGVLYFNSVGTIGSELVANINGTIYPFPFTGPGGITGPSTTTVGDLAVWNNSVGTLLKDQPVRVIYANDFGATCNESTDDSTAFQNAINQGQTHGQAVSFVGECYIATALSITAQLNFSGIGSGNGFKTNTSTLLVKSTIDAIDINTGSGSNPVYLHDFAIEYVGSAASSGTQAINVTATSGNENQNSKFERLAIGFGAQSSGFSPYVGINFINASLWSIFDCTIGFANTGVIIANTNNVDSGDSQMIGNWLDGGSGSVAVTYESSGGLRFIGNKINGSNLAAGINLQLANGAVTGLLFIVGNSFEGIAATGNTTDIGLSRLGSAGSFRYVTISGNELRGGKWCVFSPTDPNGAWLFTVSITGNVCGVTNVTGAAGFALDSTTGLTISGNVVLNGGYSSTQRVALGSSVTYAYVDEPEGDATAAGFAASTYGSSTTNVAHNLQGMAFSSLPSTIGNGSQIFVTDGDPGSGPCSGSSTGSMAFRENGAWKCF